MSNGDKIKGTAKEATGKVTRNDKLRAEGKMQKTKGKTSEKANEFADKLEGGSKGLDGDQDDKR